MPFDPHEAAKKLGLQADIQAPGSPAKFDPDQAAQSLGIQTLPNKGIIPDGPSTAEAFGRGAAQGATLGFGDELSAGLSAAIPTATDEALNRGYLDRYQQIKGQIRGENQAAQAAHPVVSALGEIAGTLPLAIATSGEGMIGRARSTGRLAAIASIGQSEDQSIPKTLDQAAKSGAAGAGLSLLLEGGTKIVKGALKSALKYPTAAFQDSYQLEQSLKDPAVASQIGQQIQETGDKLTQVAQDAKSKVGQGLETIAAKVQKPVSADSTIEKISNSLSKYAPNRNVDAVNTKADFNEFLTKISQDLNAAKDADGNVPFQVLHKTKQEIGQMIFDQGMFSKDAYTNKLATSLYSGISNTLKNAEPTGAYSNLSKVYSLLSDSNPEAFTPSAIKYLNDPFDANAMTRLSKLTGKINSLDPVLQKAYIPELTNFINQDLTNAAFKTELLKHVGGKSGILALRGLQMLPAPSGVAADLGALAGQNINKPLLNASVNAGQAALNTIKPAIPGTAASILSNRALQMVK